MKTISIINLKGGVAKTISAINIAHILATVYGKKVLLIDNDKQGNTSKLFGLYSDQIKTTADMMTEKNINITDELIRNSGYENLDIIPANMDLIYANKQVLLDVARPQQTRFRKALQQVKDYYDYCIIDNAPDLNMSVINALVASDDVIVPVKVDKFAFDGLEHLIERIEEVKDWNSNLSFKGVFLTMYQKNSVNSQGNEWLQEKSPYKTFKTVIRKTTKVDESTFANKPLLSYAKNCTAAKDYLTLIEEYLQIK